MIWKFLKELFCGKELPHWAYGLVCHVCKSSFGSARLHYDHVISNNFLDQHEDKIPVLNADKK